MNKLENLSKLIPLGSLFLIFCSAVRHVIYYSFFDIEITDYLEVQEYLTLFIDDILFYLLVFGAGLTIHLLFYKTTSEPKQFDGNQKIKLAIYILIAIVIILTSISFLFTFPRSFRAEIVGVGLFIIFTSIYLLAPHMNFRFNYLVLIAIGIFIYTIMDSCKDAFEIFEKENTKDYEFIFENKIISTNSRLHFLGQSKSYIYFYNSDERKSMVIKSDKLEDITITNGS